MKKYLIQKLIFLCLLSTSAKSTIFGQQPTLIETKEWILRKLNQYAIARVDTNGGHQISWFKAICSFEDDQLVVEYPFLSNGVKCNFRSILAIDDFISFRGYDSVNIGPILTVTTQRDAITFSGTCDNNTATGEIGQSFAFFSFRYKDEQNLIKRLNVAFNKLKLLAKKNEAY